MNIINCYNNFHLGDHIFNTILFNQITDYIEKNNIIINYYCLSSYHAQVKEFIISKNINILDLHLAESNSFNLWLGMVDDLYIDTALLKLFNDVLKINNIPLVITDFYYNGNYLLNKLGKICIKYGEKYKNIDFLMINSTCQSDQCYDNEYEWEQFIYKMNKRYKIITTKKIVDIDCTLDDNLTVNDIAAISIYCKNIIANNTGVITGLFNNITLENIDNIYYFDNTRSYYNNEKLIRIYNFDSLETLFLSNPIIENFNNTNNNNILYNLILILIIIILIIYIIDYHLYRLI
jgi:hypothetical protein